MSHEDTAEESAMQKAPSSQAVRNIDMDAYLQLLLLLPQQQQAFTLLPHPPIDDTEMGGYHGNDLGDACVARVTATLQGPHLVFQFRHFCEQSGYVQVTLLLLQGFA
jgi:hypothetical protein